MEHPDDGELRAPAAANWDSSSQLGALVRDRRVLITVHGIRTYGDWQERLEALLEQHVSTNEVEYHHFKYGFFSSIEYYLFPLRWLRGIWFRKKLNALATGSWQRVDIVAHSFGTDLTCRALLKLYQSPKFKLQVETLILSGSVLKHYFPVEELQRHGVKRIVNECGQRDGVLVLNQLAVPFSGSAGRFGFSGSFGKTLRNRLFPFKHSGYFEPHPELGYPTPNSFMEKNWVPLLTSDGDIPPAGVKPPSPLRGALDWIFRHMEPVKLGFWFSPLFAIIFVLYVQRERARDAQAAEKIARNGERVQTQLAQARLRDASIRAEGTALTLLDNRNWARAVAYLGHAVALDRDNVPARTLLWQALGADLGAASNLPARTVNLPKATQGFAIGAHGRTVTCHLDTDVQLLVDVDSGESIPLDPSRRDMRFTLPWKDVRLGHPEPHYVSEDDSRVIERLDPKRGDVWEFSPDKKAFAWAGDDGIVYWRPLTETGLRKKSQKLRGKINDLWWSPTGKALAIAHGDGRLSCIDTETGRLVGQTLEGLGEYPRFVWHPDQLKVMIIRPDSHFVLHDWRLSKTREIGWWVDAKWFMLRWEKDSGPAYVGSQSSAGLIYGVLDKELPLEFYKENVDRGELSGTSDRWEISADLRWLDTGTNVGDRTVWASSAGEAVQWLELPERVVGSAHYSDDMTWVGYRKWVTEAEAEKQVLYLWPLIVPQQRREQNWAKDRDATPAATSPDGNWIRVENRDARLGDGGFVILHAATRRRVTTPSFTRWSVSPPSWTVDGGELSVETVDGKTRWSFASPGPVESWMPLLIEAASGWRFDDNGVLKGISLDERLAARARLRQLRLDGANPDVHDLEWRRLLQWWLAPSDKRTPQPE